MMRPFLPPPIETVLVDPETETAEQRAVRRSYESGFQAGLAEGRGRGLEDGHRAGLAEGLERAQADAEAAAGQARREGLSALHRALDGLTERRAADRAALDRSLRDVLAASLRSIAPALAAAAMRTELDAILAEAMARRGTERVTLRAHPETLAELAPGSVPDVVGLMPDPGMRKDMAEASWQGGGTLFDAAALAAGVLAILTPPPADGAGPPAAPSRDIPPAPPPDGAAIPPVPSAGPDASPVSHPQENPA